MVTPGEGAYASSPMAVRDVQLLRSVNGAQENWSKLVRQHIEAGTNFLLILPNTERAIREFCKLFGYEDGCVPRTLSRGEFFLLSQFVDGDNFDEILRAWDDDHQIVYVEQIDFPINRPPRLSNYLLYSAVFGIISEHSDERDARRALSRYESNEHLHPSARRAAIYRWNNDRWMMVED
jgi:hypothetical protein